MKARHETRAAKRKYRVYVLEEVLHGKVILYVGVTGKAVSTRLHEHKNGKRYCGTCEKTRRGVTGHSVKLRRDLSPMKSFASREAAEREERRHARWLRSEGWTVKGGH